MGFGVTLEFFDDFFRFGAIAFLLWAAALLARQISERIQARLAVISGVCVASMLITTGFDQRAMFGPFGYLLVFFAELNIVFTWLFCLSLFFDSFRLRAWHWVVVIYYVVVWLTHVNDYLTILNNVYFSRAVRALIYGYLIYVVIKGRSGDLVEERRSFRIWFALAVIVTTTIISFSETYYDDFYELHIGRLLQSSTIFLVVLGFVSHITVTSKSLFFESDSGKDSKDHRKEQAVDGALIAEDRHSLDELDGLMKAGAYAEPGLTIALLAEKVRMPEHRLRRLINSHLGHRNFSQFLNAHRIEAAKSRLSNVDERHVPILTIAMDVGYMSLGPFNRAFKKQTGQTPSEYRRTVLEDKISD
jgi:AraC-like DNA-binding protein